MPSSKSHRQALRKKAAAHVLAEIAQVRLGPNTERELVNHPWHYGGDTPHEVIKCLEAWGLEHDAFLWDAVKYISQAGKKADTLGDMITDLKNAAFYLNRRIVQLQSANAEKSQAAETAEGSAKE